ncbi:MAG: hypothetical protein WD894_04040 [Pirellulales bacterium]
MPRGRVSVGIVVCMVVYLCGAVGIVLGLRHVRAEAIDELSTPEEQAHWQKWKAEAARQGGPVARRPPKSDEPPTLVLLRDHYPVLVAASLTFYSFLFALAVFLGRGMLRPS